MSFEPDVFKNGETTSTFASCGGDSVCFINSKTGKVRGGQSGIPNPDPVNSLEAVATPEKSKNEVRRRRGRILLLLLVRPHLQRYSVTDRNLKRNNYREV